MSDPQRLARRRARLAAAQALYQMEVSGTDAEAVVEEFGAHRRHQDEPEKPGETMADGDFAHFSAIVSGVVARQVEIDRLLASVLATGWALDRLDATLRASMRCAAFELLGMASVPARVVIDEYLSVIRAFFTGPEISFANGVLDAASRKARPAEFAA